MRGLAFRQKAFQPESLPQPRIILQDCDGEINNFHADYCTATLIYYLFWQFQNLESFLHMA